MFRWFYYLLGGWTGHLGLILPGDQRAFLQGIHDGGQIFGTSVVFQAAAVSIEVEFWDLRQNKEL